MGSLKLNRVDHFQINATTNRCATLLVGDGKRSFSVLAVSDTLGQVNLFRFSESGAMEQKIFHITRPVTVMKTDDRTKKYKLRMMIAHDKQISTYSIKGKNLRNYKSNVDGEIYSFDHNMNDIYLATGHVYQKVSQNKEDEFLLCPDVITDIMIVSDIGSTSDTFVALACQDCYIRILRMGVVSYELKLNSSPVCLTRGRSPDCAVYGAIDSTFGMVQFFESEAILCWEKSPHGQYGPVLAVNHFDLDQDGEPELIVAYEQGVVEVFSYDEFGYPQLIYSLDHHARLTAMAVGPFSNPIYPEIVCVTFTGSIFGLTTAPVSDRPDSGHAKNPTRIGRERILKKLREDVKQLEIEVVELRASRCQLLPSFLVLNPTELTHTFQLDPVSSTYSLRLESAIPIDHVLVQSDCPVDLLDVVDNSAVKSVIPCTSEGDNNSVLVTYRCQTNTNQMELRLRTIEGKYGTLNIYLVPQGQTPCVCTRLQFPIWPLSLHRRTHEFPEGGPINQLKLEGKFSLAELHQLIMFCLPDTPERPPLCIGPSSTEDVRTGSTECARLVYESTFLSTHLECNYERNCALFRSDNLSTISVLKDAFTKEATKRKIHFIMDLDIHPDSVEYTLRCIRPRLESLLSLRLKVRLIEPLQQFIASQTQGVHHTNNLPSDTNIPYGRGENPLPNSLPADCAAIWRDANKLQKAYRDQSCILDRLYGYLVDLYIDKYRFQGIDVKMRATDMLDILSHYDFDKLLQFFSEV
ncbi:Bardet-Biedl syndrome 7 protein [Fasciola gigantica]|uniref:Bardet-Biedl syndrome 7 protein n=1 Tax=Fasciola gigantica TaxID=46835 RepID=A0A504Z0E9_FASGI|nr:Bardet-Biedl syndrome 7 protein [Fasciola gigantica]